MPTTRGHAVPTFGDPRPRRRQLRHRQRRDRTRRELSPAQISGTAMRSVLYSAGGYLLMLGISRVAAMILGSGDSFAGLGLASLTSVTLAPLTAAIGATVGAFPYRRLRLAGRDAWLSASGFAAVVFVTIAAWIWVNPLSAMSLGLLSMTAALILRVALLERASS